MQCGQLRAHLRENIPIAEQVELVVTSPMRRALQTAVYGFSYLIKRKIPFIARAEWQENSDKPCDTGSETARMAEEFPDVDFGYVDVEWPAKSGKYEFAQDAVLQRGVEARRWLRSRPEKVIAVVSHSAFLRTSIAPARWANADYRIFEFEEEDDEGCSARLVQWKSTETYGGGMGRSVRGVMGVEAGDFPERPNS